jgi:hypothetical protein
MSDLFVIFSAYRHMNCEQPHDVCVLGQENLPLVNISWGIFYTGLFFFNHAYCF